MGPTFYFTRGIWTLAEKIWLPPTLWLNKQVFHFKYIPDSWTTFSGSLHTIRDTGYLVLSSLVCVGWTIFDKKRANYNKLQYWFSESLAVALSCMLFSYGIIKIFPLQMRSPTLITLYKPIGDQVPYELLFDALGFGTPYVIFSGFLEALGAVMILFKRTRAAGLVIITCVMLNITMLNYAFQIGVLITSLYMLLMTLFLLAPYSRQVLRFFFASQPALLVQPEYMPGKNFKTVSFKIILLAFLGISFFVNIRSSYKDYIIASSIANSRQYSLVKNYVAGMDTLKLIDKDTVCWRIWSERIASGKLTVTITTMNPAFFRTYWIARDTAKHLLTLRPLSPTDSSSFTFTYKELNKNNWRLEGVFKQKNISVDLQRVSPDTTVTLMKSKRTFIVTDDE